METTETLRRAIAVTTELHSVVKTMKALAGVNIRQYERAAHAVAEYNRTVEMGLEIALQRMPPHAMPPRYAAGRKLGAVVFGSDQGMCGQLNDQVVSHALRALKKLAFRHDDQATMAVGVRAASQLEEEGRTVELTVDVPASTAGIGAAVEQVLQKIEEWHTRRQRGNDRAILCSAGIRRMVSRARRPDSFRWTRNGSTDSERSRGRRR